MFCVVVCSEQDGLSQFESHTLVIEVAILKQCGREKFTFPEPVEMPNIRRFLVHRTEQKDGLSKFTRQNLKNFKNKCAEATSKEVMILDLLASEKFGSAISGKCPRITRAYLISSQPAIFAILLFLNCCFVVFCVFLVWFLELNWMTWPFQNRGEESQMAFGSSLTIGGQTYMNLANSRVGPKAG